MLEIACGNAVFPRHLARLGVLVGATDFSVQLLERARALTAEDSDRITYQFVDVISEDQIVALDLYCFDAAVCNTRADVSNSVSLISEGLLCHQ